MGRECVEPGELISAVAATRRMSPSLRFAGLAVGRSAWHDALRMAKVDPQQAQTAFAQAQQHWRAAIDAHRTAPPDGGFSARLATLAQAAFEEARVCLEADEAGFEWPPHRSGNSEPPQELRPGSGRRGPEELWRRFDLAVSELGRAATGRDLQAVARAYEELGDVTGELASAVEAEDRKSGLLPARARSRAQRRSA